MNYCEKLEFLEKMVGFSIPLHFRPEDKGTLVLKPYPDSEFGYTLNKFFRVLNISALYGERPAGTAQIIYMEMENGETIQCINLADIVAFKRDRLSLTDRIFLEDCDVSLIACSFLDVRVVKHDPDFFEKKEGKVLKFSRGARIKRGLADSMFQY